MRRILATIAVVVFLGGGSSTANEPRSSVKQERLMKAKRDLLRQREQKREELYKRVLDAKRRLLR